MAVNKAVNNGKQRKCNVINVGIKNQLFEPVPNGKTFFYLIPKLCNQMITPSQAKAPSVDAFKQHFKCI